MVSLRILQMSAMCEVLGFCVLFFVEYQGQIVKIEIGCCLRSQALGI